MNKAGSYSYKGRAKDGYSSKIVLANDDFSTIKIAIEEGIMEREPRDTKKSIIDKKQAFKIGYVSILMAGLSLLSHNWFISNGAGNATASTMVVNILVISKIFYLFNIRTPKPAFSKESFRNKKAFLIIGIMIILQLILTYVPFMQRYFYTEGLSILEWLVATGIGFIVLLVTEIDKLIRTKFFNKSKG